MHIELANFVLFLHIGVAVFTFGIAGLLLTSLMQMRAATEMSVLRSWQRVSHRVEPWFPILVLILIALGAWLLHLSGGEFRWSDGWVIVAVTGLVLMEAYGGAVLAPAGKALHALVEETPDGPVPANVRAAILAPKVWAGAFGNTGIALGILFNMPTKPAGPYAVAIVVVTAAVWTLLGLRLAQAPHQQVEAEREGVRAFKRASTG